MVRSEGNMSLKNPVTPPRIDPRTVRLVARRLKHYATPDPIQYIMVDIIQILFFSKTGLRKLWVLKTSKVTLRIQTREDGKFSSA
jgi:hypothetical protein